MTITTEKITSTSSIEWRSIPMREVVSRLDPALPCLLDVYQKSFPVEEQMLVSFFLEKLAQKEKGEGRQFHLDVLSRERDVAGFAFYEVGEEVEGLGRGGYLWFIAANPDLRGGGIGKRLYRHVINEMFLKYGCRALFFEIEETNDALNRHGQAAADYAEWRKAWYKRQGAFELHGTHYMCGVGWHPAIPMKIMVHPNGPLMPIDALHLARNVQDESIEIVDELAFV